MDEGLLDRGWVTAAGPAIADRAERELDALVGVSSPSGDVAGAEEVIAIASALLPPVVEVERPACSTPGYAPDLLARLRGTGRGRILLLGHVDTVVEHGQHRPMTADGDRLLGSGTVDMKGGDVLALGIMRALADRTGEFEEVALLLVTDEEWRTGPLNYGAEFAGFDACLCFEAGESDAEGNDAVVVRRKAAATVVVRAQGRAAHSGAAPELGRNALLALGEAARIVADANDPDGPDRVTAVPTMIKCGDAFNVVPATGELICDLRGDRLSALEAVLDRIPPSFEGVELTSELARRWPGMDTRSVAAPVLSSAAELLGRPIIAGERGGASDASSLAAHVPLAIDGLGPLGGAAHNPEEYILRDSLRTRAEVALAVAATVLGGVED